MRASSQATVTIVFGLFAATCWAETLITAVAFLLVSIAIAFEIMMDGGGVT